MPFAFQYPCCEHCEHCDRSAAHDLFKDNHAFPCPICKQKRIEVVAPWNVNHLRAAWEHATERIDSRTENLRGAKPYSPYDMLIQTLAGYTELADAVQRYLGITVDHDKLKED